MADKKIWLVDNDPFQHIMISSILNAPDRDFSTTCSASE